MPTFAPDILTTIHVEGAEQLEAVDVLKQKRLKGKTYEEITGITDKYYLKKIINGEIKMSAYIYFKIMDINPSGEVIQFGNGKVRLRKCIRCGEYTNLNNPYCRECNELLGRVNHAVKFDKQESGVVKPIHG